VVGYRRGRVVSNTPARAVRVPDELWNEALLMAMQKGDTLREVIRRALVEYVETHGWGV